jgi:hypothetical protein
MVGSNRSPISMCGGTELLRSMFFSYPTVHGRNAATLDEPALCRKLVIGM